MSDILAVIGTDSSRLATQESDVALVGRVRRGDPDAMNIVLSRYWSDIVNFLTAVWCGRDDAKDVAQEVFIRLWNGQVTWPGEGLLRTFLFGVARNLARNDARRERGRRDLSIHAENARPTQRTPADELDERELQARVRSAVAALSPKRREVFILARIHDCTYHEIAKILGRSPQTIANHMSAVLSELRLRLGDVLE